MLLKCTCKAGARAPAAPGAAPPLVRTYLEVELGAVLLEEVEDGEEVVGVHVRVHQDPPGRRRPPARRGELRHEKEKKQGEHPRRYEPTTHPELRIDLPRKMPKWT
jgi:hypothetical protein